MKPLRRNKRKDRLIIAGAILVAAVLIYLVAFAHKPDNSQTVNPSTRQAQNQARSAAQNSGSSTQKTSSIGTSIQGNTTPGSGGSGTSSGGPAPATPTGDWVSSHTVHSSDGMDSVCTTTQGATCQITFTNTKTGATKSLGAQTVDSSGSTTWSWTAGSLLTPGTWAIAVTSVLNGKSATAKDATNLVVQ